MQKQLVKSSEEIVRLRDEEGMRKREVEDFKQEL